MVWMTRALGLALTLLLVPPAAAKQGDALVLARINGEPITLGQLRADFWQRHRRHLRMVGGESVVRDFLNAQIERRLFVEEAYRLGLQDDPGIDELVTRERLRVASEWLFESEVTDRVRVTDEQIDAALERSRTLIEIVRVECDSAEAAEAARQRVLDGEPAEAVARQVSTARSKTRGGLEVVSWGRAEPEFERVVLAAAEGDVTPVVEIESGWVFAKIVSGKTIDLEDPAAERSRIVERLRFRATAERRNAYLDDLRGRHRARFFSERIGPDVLVPLLSDDRPENSDPTPVAELEGEVITLGEFVQSIRPRAYLALTPAQQERQARFLLENRLDQLVLRREGLRRWDDAPDDVKNQLRAVRDDLMFRKLLADYVFDALDASDEEIEARYHEHEQRYVEPVRIRLAIALLETEDEARRFLEEVRSGGSFEELARERSRDRQTAALGGLAGWVSQDQAVRELRGEPFRTAMNEVGGPLRLDDGWLVFRVVDRTESRPIPLAEARDRVRDEILRDKSARRQQEWSVKLREASEVTLNERAIRKAARLLERESEEVFEVPAMPAGHGQPQPGGENGHP